MTKQAKPRAERFVQVRSPANDVIVRPARGLDDLMRVVALRAVVFMGEQRCPYEEEFDGNDLTAATHLLAMVHGEPAGTLRLRWFADFVKIERVAVKPGARNGQVVAALMAHAVEMARRRGYRTALGYIQVRLAPFWARLGFLPRPGRTRFTFSDHEYLEVEGRLEPHPQALTIDAPPFVLMRPDGAWDEPGVLDHSAARPASNPHV